MAKAQPAEPTRAQLLNKAYGVASAALRDGHREEFNKLHQKAAHDLGIEWSPKLTAEERAAQEFDALLATFPHLAERLPVESDEDSGQPPVPAE
jgi:hypothetical protein